MRVEKYESTNIEKERYEQATEKQKYVFRRCWDMWDPRTVIPMEVGNWYSSELQEDKDIHTVLDCSSAIDYLVDPFTDPPFGINHRVHSPSDKELRFDLRAKNNNGSESELETLKGGINGLEIIPKYATRMKLDKDGIEWFRIVHLKPLIEAIENAGLYPADDYVTEDHTAYFYEYSLLQDMKAVVAEFDGEGNEIFAQNDHKSL